MLLISSHGGPDKSACQILGDSFHAFSRKCPEASNLTSFTSQNGAKRPKINPWFKQFTTNKIQGLFKDKFILFKHYRNYKVPERERLSLSAFLRTEDIGVHIVHISRVIITYTLE